MNRKELIELLNRYETSYTEETEYKAQIIDFINGNGIILGKENPEGHITGSAWILSRDRKKVLLTHHYKLNRWLQLGGHTEAGEPVEVGALREAKEESGLSDIRFLSKEIFDIDVHKIPARGFEKEHFHYDIRFVFEADPNQELHVSNESMDVKWIDLDEADMYSQSKSLLRMVEKTKTR